jgi:two-component system phosphate regulon sensor histidine kinase PhoR
MLKKLSRSFNFHSLRWRLSLVFFFSIIGCLLLLTFFLASYVKDLYLHDLEERLVAEAHLSAAHFAGQDIDLSNCQALVDQTARLSGARVTLIRQDGVVLADSQARAADLENHANRPEVQAVMRNPSGFGEAERFSVSIRSNLLYIAVITPQVTGSELSGTIVRLALPTDRIDQALNSIWLTFSLTALVVGLLAILVGQWQLNRLVRPLGEVIKAARALGRGDFKVRVGPGPYPEFGTIAKTFNHVAGQLDQLIGTLNEERQMLRAVLENMEDGVVILDSELSLLSLNPAARRLLDISNAGEVTGNTLMMVTQDHEIYQLVNQALDTGQPAAQLLERPLKIKSLQVTAIPLKQTQHGRVLLILHDLTELHRVEKVRRDFVANISHELRTPLASIKVMNETVEMILEEDPATARQMISRITAEVNGLTELVKELLNLTTLQSGKLNFEFSRVELEPLVQEVIMALKPLADQKNQSLKLIDLDPTTPLTEAILDREKIMIVLRNLVQNAIKYTPDGGSIEVTVQLQQGPTGYFGQVSSDEWLKLTVKDNGVGLTREEHQRVFERFYKVDKSRSADAGSGIGLAIAKHIVLGHHGAIWVESEPGKGSTFAFTLPIRQP